MNTRDYDYVETRLLAPCSEAMDAIERLRQIGEDALADRVLEGVRALNDACYDVRRGLPPRGAQ